VPTCSSLLRAGRGRDLRLLSPAIFGQIVLALFPRWGDPSDALARIAAKNPERRWQPLMPDPQGPRLRVSPHREREESAASPSLQAAPTAAVLGWRRRRRPGRRFDRAQALTRLCLSGPPDHAQDFLRCRARRAQAAKLRRTAGSARSARPGSRSPNRSFVETHRLLHHCGSDGIQGRWVWCRRDRARAPLPKVLTREDACCPVTPSVGLKSQSHLPLCHWVIDACHHRHAAHGAAGACRWKNSRLVGIFTCCTRCRELLEQSWADQVAADSKARNIPKGSRNAAAAFRRRL